MSRREPSRPSVTVKIAGEEHSLRTDAPPEYTRAVAAHVDATVRGLISAQSLEPHRAAVLAALHITDELFRLRDQLQRLTAELNARSSVLADSLEQATGGGSFTPLEPEE